MVKYTDSLMLEVREMKEGSGFISLKVLQLLFFVLLLASKIPFAFFLVGILHMNVTYIQPLLTLYP